MSLSAEYTNPGRRVKWLLYYYLRFNSYYRCTPASMDRRYLLLLLCYLAHTPMACKKVSQWSNYFILTAFCGLLSTHFFSYGALLHDQLLVLCCTFLLPTAQRVSLLQRPWVYHSEARGFQVCTHPGALGRMERPRGHWNSIFSIP